MSLLCNRKFRRLAFLIAIFFGATFSYVVFTVIKPVVFLQEHIKGVTGGDKLSYVSSIDSAQSGHGCQHPKLQLFHPEIAKLFKNYKKYACNKESNWVYIENGTFMISDSIKELEKPISCDIIPLVRGSNDFTTIQGTRRSIQEGDPIPSDFFHVECKGKKHTHRMFHSAIARQQEVVKRAQSKTPPGDALGLNVIMFGFDSVSHLTWLRNLPKTTDFFAKEMDGIILDGYNIVGDGTPQALLPILTGKTEPELPEARRGHSGAKTVDNHPWIWKDLQDIGYATQWGEDGAAFGTFTYRMLGFKKAPVDHYMRPFYLALDKERKLHKTRCVGDALTSTNMLKWIEHFYDAYPDIPKFSFVFHSEFTHGGYAELKNADDDLLQFLKTMQNKGHFDNTLFILMADHGARFTALRNTQQGKMEERLPFFSFRFPAAFAKEHPNVIKNLKKNANRLTTPFDIHETFLDLIHFRGTGLGDLSERGISLFKEVPANRTCSEAGVDAHWCSCVDWKYVDRSDSKVKAAAEALVAKLNEIAAEEKELCAELKLYNITQAKAGLPKSNLLKFKHSADHDGRLPDLSDSMNPSEVVFEISIETIPGHGTYEAAVTSSLGPTKTHLVDPRQISRTNKYGLQPHCVMENHPHLRPYCYCKKQKDSLDLENRSLTTK